VQPAAKQFMQQVSYPLTGRSSGLPHGCTPIPAVHFQQLQQADLADRQLSEPMHILALTIFEIPSAWAEPFTWGYRLQGSCVPILPSLAADT
jgi:hypothetical protein